MYPHQEAGKLGTGVAPALGHAPWRLKARSWRDSGPTAGEVHVADVEANDFGEPQASAEGQAVDRVVAQIAGGRREDELLCALG